MEMLPSPKLVKIIGNHKSRSDIKISKNMARPIQIKKDINYNLTRTKDLTTT